LVVRQLVVVGRGDVRDAGRACGLDQPRHRRPSLRRARDRELPVGVHEVHLRVDVPQEPPHATSSSRGFGRNRRPTFAEGLPSVTTMSPVKSFEPRIREEPTPYASTGTPFRSNSRILSVVKPPETTIFTAGNPAASSASRTFCTRRGLTPVGLKSPISS